MCTSCVLVDIYWQAKNVKQRTVCPFLFEEQNMLLFSNPIFVVIYDHYVINQKKTEQES